MLKGAGWDWSGHRKKENLVGGSGLVRTNNKKGSEDYSLAQVGLSMLVLVGQRSQAAGEKEVVSEKKNPGERGKKSNRKGGGDQKFDP